MSERKNTSPVTWTQKWGNIAQIAAAFASITTMGVAIIGLTVFSPVFRNLQLTEENARLQLANQNIEQELSARRNEREQLVKENEEIREELNRYNLDLSNLLSGNRVMEEELSRQREDQTRLLLSNQQLQQDLDARRSELRRLGVTARNQRAAAWSYVCNQIKTSAHSRLNSASDEQLRMLRWLRDGIEFGLSRGDYTGNELFSDQRISEWTQTLSPEIRVRFQDFLTRFTSTRANILRQQYIRRASTSERDFEGVPNVLAQLRIIIDQFDEECRTAQP